MNSAFTLHHHGATDGVTASCHAVELAGGQSVLIGGGIFQGAETSSDQSSFEQL